MLVSINPFKPLTIYSPEVMEQYIDCLELNQIMPPHIFALADKCYRELKWKRKDQSVIIAGESGSGKTEAAKLVLQYIAQVSSQGSPMEQLVLEANPILESLGNAKTSRNNNSSRFGKLIELFFDPINHSIQGLGITSYLLEKSRVVRVAENER